jgi:hypothetical protein
MSFVDADHGFVAIGDVSASRLSSQLLATSDGGSHWTAHALPESKAQGIVAGLDFTSSSTGWVVMERRGDAQVFRTSDGANTWTECASIVAATPTVPNGYLHVEGVRFANPKLGWVAGWYSSASENTRAFYWVTRDGCATWIPSQLPTGSVQEITVVDLPEMVGNEFIGGVTTRDPNSGIYQLAVFYSADGVSRWLVRDGLITSHNTPTWAPTGSIGIAIVADGKIRSQAPSPASPNALTIQALQFVNSRVGFADAFDGTNTGLYRTSDGGRTWSLMRAG